MKSALYHEELLDEYEVTLTENHGDFIVLSANSNPFFPKGGGQPADKGELISNDGREKFSVVDVESIAGKTKIFLDRPFPDNMNGRLHARVDRKTRTIHSRLHTALHILNSLVFKKFGAQVTGAQIHSDGTGRMDFNLPDIPNSVLRELEGPLNDLGAADLSVKTFFLPREEAMALPGIQRTMNRSIPNSVDGKIRIVQIDGIDQQGCGGTHVQRTSLVGMILVLKIDNKGKGNRRVSIKLADI